MIVISGQAATVTVRTFENVEPDLAFDVAGDMQTYLLQLDVTSAEIRLPGHDQTWTADPIPRLPLGHGRTLTFAVAAAAPV